MFNQFANLVNPDLCVMPLWCWAFLLYGIFTAVTKVTFFLCGDVKRKTRKNRRR